MARARRREKLLELSEAPGDTHGKDSSRVEESQAQDTCSKKQRTKEKERKRKKLVIRKQDNEGKRERENRSERCRKIMMGRMVRNYNEYGDKEVHLSEKEIVHSPTSIDTNS